MGVRISGIYGSEEISANGHQEGHVTLSTAEIRERMSELGDSGATSVDLKAIEKYLAKVDKRDERNRRPEVKAARKLYNKKRLAAEKQTKAMIEILLAEKEGLV